ncbi:MAG: hypothetical protein PVH89_00510 [Gammaproteobacteria bacterium]|jgi:hypothetical protein
MKYALSLTGGLLLGVISALALVYFNPLIRGQGEHTDNDAWVLEYRLAADETWLSTHDERVEIPLVPKAAPLLWEDGIRGAWLAAMPLEAGSGDAPAAATRISLPSSKTNFLNSGVVVDDYWLISVADAGTLLVRGTNNQWPLLRDTVVSVDLLRRDFAGPTTYDATRGPDDGHAVVTGITGAYQSSRGRAHERVSLETYDGSLASASGKLVIAFDDDGGN